jgi:glycosyltransferase involved in cell wall biosynthesis
MSETLVIMPTYNESMNIRHSIEQLFKHNTGVHLLVVDDNSPDGTAAEVEKLMPTYAERLFLLNRPGKSGLGPAYLAGFAWAFERNYLRIAEMDADGSHRAADLGALLSQRGFDLVIGSRWISGGSVVNWPLSRVLISKIGNLYTRIVLGTKVRDMTAGFRVYRSALLKRLPLDKIASQGYSFQVEMAYRSIQLDASVIEVPITFVEREHGASKMSSKIVFEALWLVTKWGVARLFRAKS